MRKHQESYVILRDVIFNEQDFGYKTKEVPEQISQETFEVRTSKSCS